MPTNTAVRPADVEAAKAWDIAATVCDPEIPVINIAELGILRSVRTLAGEYDGAGNPAVEVTITPTYSGCPAMDAIRDDVVAALKAKGYGDVRVKLVLAPAWTTDWMTPEGKAKLNEYGIAPPTGLAGVRSGPVSLGLSVKCPLCNSLNTRELTRFGSTSCKALYQCNECKEPFDYFKVL
ncbi:1,2-phenylacetyl-CoA epoxidase subunit PaaD [Arthrobacter crystallopoietes]|uniref:1,2-phenylacetyl-CoA epoxidase subunit PaaD n=1 Tax=Micrococcaceae TaxID=1268 RepID=UPI0021C99E8D|nr:1,2-phenylacetyl-CoA epoxidase subunit PaaD [Arthrobacter sp. Marseille-P9274]